MSSFKAVAVPARVPSRTNLGLKSGRTLHTHEEAMATMNKPTWFKPEHASEWARIKEALRRDWDQTKHDLHMGGHNLNQTIADTGEQLGGVNPPPDERPMPAKVIGDVSDWETVEEPVGYGYAARAQYGTQHPKWNDKLETTLHSEWDGMRAGAGRTWDEVKGKVRHGYEYLDRPSHAPTTPGAAPGATTAHR
jgi:hypothetical protein